MKNRYNERYIELLGVAGALNTTVERVVMANYIIEMQSFCTSIVARQKDGSILHLRMVDFFDSDVLRDVAYKG